MALWSLTDKRILIVDDFPEMRSLMRSMVTAFGAQQVHLAVDGEEAVDAMAARRFDIVLCDYNLGDGKDGQQVLEEASHRGLLSRSTVFVMVTAENTSQMVMGALEHQPDGYIAKPVTKTVLQTRLQKLLNKKDTLSDINQALDRKQFEKAIERCDAHIAADSKYRFELLKIKSDVLIKTADYDGAAALCEAVLAERELPWALFDMGRIHYHRSRYDDAAEVFSRVIAINNAFVSAYDWLAKTQEQLGDHTSVQRTLMDAVEKSSKSLLRLRALAAAADRNEDGAVTEQARRKAIRVGKGSVLRRPSDYTGLARTLLKNSSGKDALKTIDAIKYEFRDNPQAELEAAAVGSTIHAALGNDKPGKVAIEKAIELATRHPELLNADGGVDLVQACLAHDRKQEAIEFVRNIVRNNHDDEAVLGRISDLYEDTGALGEISGVIENTRKEIVRINNEGVKLLKDGRIRESIELFAEAAKGMPRNPIINLNAAQSLITMMKTSQPTRSALEETLSYIRAANDCETHRERQSRLLAVCRELSACL
jgi:CheY-like chemotaxis protein